MFDTSTRLNKYISESGICSRREADRFIEQGNVYINGKRATVGDRVKAGDLVKVNGRQIEPRSENALMLIALNKPVGVVSTTEAAVKNNIVDFVNLPMRVFPVGRLDKDSQGLIFLTNNGDIVNKILRAGNNHEKEYVVTVNKPVTDEFVSGMASGVPMLGVKTKKCKVEREAANVFRITLVQGLNRQIRRMCEHFGYEVLKLERVRIMNVNLKGLALGEWRDLTPAELEQIGSMIKDSSAAPKKSGGRKPKKPRPDFDKLYPESADNKRGRSLSKNRSSKNSHKSGRPQAAGGKPGSARSGGKPSSGRPGKGRGGRSGKA